MSAEEPKEVTGGRRGHVEKRQPRLHSALCPGRSALLALDLFRFLPSRVGTAGGNLHCEMGEPIAVVFGRGNGDFESSFSGYFNGQSWL